MRRSTGRGQCIRCTPLRGAAFKAPIVYFVDRSRDDHSFSGRVTAIQHGEQIFHMAASFRRRSQGWNIRPGAGGAVPGRSCRCR
jgi:acyl-CoA thioesterase